MEKKVNIWGKWLYWFVFAVAVIAIYKTLDNFNDITNWIKDILTVCGTCNAIYYWNSTCIFILYSM